MKLTYTIALLLVLGASPVVVPAQELLPCGKNHFILDFPCIPDDTAAWAWYRAGDMHVPRTRHTATKLADGRVLVAGGSGRFETLKSAEIYDPVADTWTLTGEMGSARDSHTAARLPDGRVLVVGGSPGLQGIDSAELYDPRTGTWTRAAAMLAPRGSHAMTLLANGTILVTGGVNEDHSWDDLALRTAEIYDPVANSWRYAASMVAPRHWHTLTLLADGKVLAAGGATLVESHGYTSTAELYDPGSDSWIPAGVIGTARSSTTATTLPDGNVLVAGGYSTCLHSEPAQNPTVFGYVCSHAETALFNPVTGWGRAAPLNAPRSRHTTTRLANGTLLVAGGDHWAFTQYLWYESSRASGLTTLASTELYDPVTGTWTFAGDLSIARVGHTATLLDDGTVLVVGGNIGPPHASTEIFGPPRPMAPGMLAFVSERDGNSEIYVVNVDGTGLRRLTDDAGVDVDPAWSPDGKRIAFASNRAGNSDIYVMDADGSNLVRRTQNGWSDSPAWSPDGEEIAFSSLRGGQFGIYVMSVDGDWANPTRVGYDRGWNAHPAWSPDGERIAFISDWQMFDFFYDLYIMNADGSQTTALFGSGAYHFQPSWSPDGAKIAFVVCDYAWDICYPSSSIAIVNADGSGLKTPVRTGGFARPTWSPDGSTIAFSSRACRTCEGELRYVRADGGRTGVIFSNGHSPAWRP